MGNPGPEDFDSTAGSHGFSRFVSDLFVQFSGLRTPWEKTRWIVLLVGSAFAAVIAHFFSMAILSDPSVS